MCHRPDNFHTPDNDRTKAQAVQSWTSMTDVADSMVTSLLEWGSSTAEGVATDEEMTSLKSVETSTAPFTYRLVSQIKTSASITTLSTNFTTQASLQSTANQKIVTTPTKSSTSSNRSLWNSFQAQPNGKIWYAFVV